MYLIATGKIAEYITSNPTARIDLLKWLKEYPYGQGRNMFSDREHTPLFTNGTGMAHLDKGDYTVSYRINYPAKAVYITWVGSADDINREIKEREQRYPGSTRVKTTVRHMRIPSREELSQASYQQKGEEPNVPFTLSATQQALNDTDSLNSPDDSFKTEAEYLAGLDRTNTIFEAEPGTSEFNELLKLLPLVKHYEDYKLKFPQLQPYEIVNHKMKVLDMIPSYFTAVIDVEELQQFLAGNLVLPPDVLQKLYNFLYIRLPVNDMRFVSVS